MAMRRIQALLIAGLLGASGWLASPPDAAAQQVLRIGEFVTLTGPLAAYGNQLHRARALGLEEINARGGVNVGGSRVKVELVSLDAGPPGEALKVFERLLSVEKVSLVLDGLFSSTQYAMGPILKGKNAIVIWSGGNDPGTTVGVPNAFRNHFDGGNPFMKVSGDFLRKMGVKRIATYGTTGHVEFKKFVEDYLPKQPGVQVVATEWHSFGEKDFFPILTNMPNFMVGTKDNTACPIVAGCPDVLKAAFTKETDFFATRGIRYVDPADLARPRSQRYQVFIDAPVELP